MNKAAKRYAKALFELAENQNKLDLVYSDLKMIYQTIESSDELKTLLTNPILTKNKKVQIVQKIFNGKMDDLTAKLIHLLGEKDRLDLLPSIYKSFDSLYNQKKGIVHAIITTPVEMNKQLEKEIYKKIQSLTGSKKIQLKKNIDPSLLGGFVLQIDDLKYDASILGKLAKIKSKLVEN